MSGHRPWLFRAVLCLSICLSACAERPEVRRDVHTGITTTASSSHILERSATGRLVARAVHQSRDGRDFWWIYTIAQRDDGNFPEISGAWSYGKAMPYQRFDRKFAACYGLCVREEAGGIPLSGTEFRAAAKTGVSFKLSGRRGGYSGDLPAEAFQQVLTLLDG